MFSQIFKGTGLKLKSEKLDIQPPKDLLLQLVSLQKASGFWQLDADLAAVFGKTKKEVKKSEPKSVNNEVWASILALIWLHGFKMDAKEEWELLTMKTATWIKAQNGNTDNQQEIAVVIGVLKKTVLEEKD
ncbi:PREDICTED: von Willebrand factor A domain-containing protein 5A-like [Cyprinodon variegatus]|uniref:von Willebrand factor A domain-containing protein 5A-like n=1 Tax=Cyprinodon variegatus TaxID=28743 RepID=UPI000742836A|nr:PREDICTED: von Willebrand factor A domain-containing protein 5A-like [Cyprinodon variegatus]